MPNAWDECNSAACLCRGTAFEDQASNIEHRLVVLPLYLPLVASSIGWASWQWETWLASLVAQELPCDLQIVHEPFCHAGMIELLLENGIPHEVSE